MQQLLCYKNTSTTLVKQQTIQAWLCSLAHKFNSRRFSHMHLYKKTEKQQEDEIFLEHMFRGTFLAFSWDHSDRSLSSSNQLLCLEWIALCCIFMSFNYCRSIYIWVLRTNIRWILADEVIRKGPVIELAWNDCAPVYRDIYHLERENSEILTGLT